jgi:hypothetical protein
MATNRNSAPGPAAGYSYQFERALNWLSQKEAGASIGIETADDVEVRDPDFTAVLEQDKHSNLDLAQPFGDRSKGLWNTLAIWVEAVDSGQRPKEITSFLMVTNKVVPECIARRIARAGSEGEADACLTELQVAGVDPPKHIAKAVERVLRPTSRSTLREVVRRVDLSDASAGAATADLRKGAIAHLQLPKWCLPVSDSIANELLGWLHTAAMSLWEQGQPAWTSVIT